MAAKKGLSAQSARNRQAAYDFRGEDEFKPVSVLSGGEQSRLRLCMLMDDEINFLILDEPTNHLDIDSREWIEEAVEAYDGTLLFVSHDRYFINRFATRIWELADGTITDYPCGFAQYRQMKAQEEAEKAQSAARAFFGGGGDTADMPCTCLCREDAQGDSIGLLDLMVKCKLAPSKKEARRLVEQGGVEVNSEKVTDVSASFTCAAFCGEGLVIKKGKKVFHKVTMAQ